ncbi:Hypothetical protein SRAE_2000060700 [Strongyloides ratti]|uniref:Uncharacterized protein n=1 Tax=Strongyloides ratti TaxID=34506 RepID=A0A090LCT1_STRRB|nr:Hypothetical protein SRAE_2000060700 [Strongyloides ratti]CEF65933.1 Hypothetical protein SRAE_2000060700 [Strongyloides ratti]
MQNKNICYSYFSPSLKENYSKNYTVLNKDDIYSIVNMDYKKFLNYSNLQNGIIEIYLLTENFCIDSMKKLLN